MRVAGYVDVLNSDALPLRAPLYPSNFFQTVVLGLVGALDGLLSL